MNFIKKIKENSFKKNYFLPIWDLLRQSDVKYIKLIFVVFLTILVACCEALFIWLLAPFTNSVINKNQVSGSEFGIISVISNSPFLLLLFLIFTLFFKIIIKYIYELLCYEDKINYKKEIKN